MSKSHRKIDNKRQVTIFDLIKELSRSHPTTEGKFKIIDQLRIAIREAIKNSPLSRHQIAGEMGHLLGETITKEMIDSWTRGSDELNGRPGRHIPSEYLPAFCYVTECNTPLQIMAEIAGVFMMPGPEALRAEIQKLDEQIKGAQAKKKKRQLFLKEMERR